MSITVDKVTLEIAIKHDKARQEIADITGRLQGETKQLKELEQAKRKAMKKYKDESHPEVVKATQAYEEQTKKIDALRSRKDELRRSLKVEGLSIAEVRDELKKYNMQLQNLTPGTEKFNETKQHVDELTARLKELRTATAGTQESLGKFSGGGFLKNILGAGFDFKSIKSFLAGNAITAAATFVFDTVADYAGRAIDRVKTLVSESVAAARSAEGITRAFEHLDSPGLLDNLRSATHGTVSDLELMKAAVQANDFRLPLDQMGKYLEFAQLKAQQTGQSVDFLTSSIVTGLGRKSLQILDNLGLSASEVKEEMEKTGDMATAVGNIIDRQLAEAGEHFETAAEREAQATTDVTNAQLELGQQMRKTFGIGSTSMSELQAKAEAFVLRALTKIIVYCQDLYDRLVYVRVAVETVKAAFDTVFKVCELGFKWLIDTIKGVARTFRDLGGLMESLLTFNPDRIEQAWQKMLAGMGRSVKEFVDDGKDVGRRWGQNVNDGIRAVMGKTKPRVEDPAIIPSSPTDDTDPKPKPGKSSNSVPSAAVSQQPDAYRQQLAARERAYREYDNSLRQMLLHQYITEEEYRQESLEAELKFLSDKAALQQQYGEDVTDTQRQYLDRMLQEATRRYQQEQQLLKQQQEQERRELERNRLSQEGNNEYLQKVEWQGQSFDRMRQLNDEYLRQNLISYQQYQDNLTDIARQQSEQRQQIQQAATDATQQLLSSASSFFSAMQSRETAEVDAKYKRMIAAAKKQGRDTTRLEEQQEQEKQAVQKKYADRNFQIQVLQIIGNTAQGISKTIAELGMPWAVPFVAMAAAAGAMQLASAKAAADQAAGLYKGGFSEGYTKRGDPRRQAGVIPVHRNEFVANHRAVANPQVRPVLDVIDAHQRRGDIHLLNATRLLDEAYGRYRGGYSQSAPASVPSAAVPQQPAAQSLLPVLERIEQNTARSLTVRDLRREIAHEEQLERNARR